MSESLSRKATLVNRYVIAGVLADMRAGRRVVLVSKDQPCTREAFGAVGFWLRDDERRVRTSGWERCESADGRGSVRFVSIDASLRGMTGDVVIVDADPSPRQLTEVLRMVDMCGEVIVL